MNPMSIQKLQVRWENYCASSIEINVINDSCGNIECTMNQSNIKVRKSDQTDQLVSTMLQGRSKSKAKIMLEVEFYK